MDHENGDLLENVRKTLLWPRTIYRAKGRYNHGQNAACNFLLPFVRKLRSKPTLRNKTIMD